MQLGWQLALRLVIESDDEQLGVLVDLVLLLHDLVQLEVDFLEALRIALSLDSLVDRAHDLWVRERVVVVVEGEPVLLKQIGRETGLSDALGVDSLRHFLVHFYIGWFGQVDVDTLDAAVEHAWKSGILFERVLDGSSDALALDVDHGVFVVVLVELVFDRAVALLLVLGVDVLNLSPQRQSFIFLPNQTRNFLLILWVLLVVKVLADRF